MSADSRRGGAAAWGSCSAGDRVAGGNLYMALAAFPAGRVCMQAQLVFDLGLTSCCVGRYLSHTTADELRG